MKSKNRSMLGVTAAVLLALVGGLLLWQNSDSSESGAVEEPVVEVQVLIARRDIPAGEPASTMADNAYAFVELVPIPEDQVEPGALESTDNLDELALARNVTSHLVTNGAQLTVEDFIVPGQQELSALPDIEDDLFEITVAMEPQRAFGGNLRAGNTVAILGSFEAEGARPGQTVVILESVLITNVQSEQLFSQEQLSSDPLAPSLAPTSRLFVTFGIPVDDLERLTYGIEFGRIWIAHQRSEATIDGSKVRDRESVVRSLTDPVEEVDENTPATAEDTVEVDGDGAG
jgi:pilus assembly protein CpaB